jgi:hypothetical protein
MTMAIAANHVTGRHYQRILRLAVLLAMIVPAVASVVVTSPVPVDVRMEAALLCAFCLAPAWQYLGSSSRRPPIPFISIIGVLYAIYFALPAALGSYNQHYKIVLTPTRDYDDAVFVALAGWIALLCGLAVGRLVIPASPATKHMQVTDGRLKRYGAPLLLIGLAVDLFRRVAPVPIEIAGVLVFATSLGWFGSGILVMLNVRGELTTPWRLLTYAGVAAFFLLGIGSGSVAAAAFYGTIIVVAAWIGRGRLSTTWIMGILLAAILIVSLRGVTDQYRKMAWYTNEGQSAIEGPLMFFGLLQKRIVSDGIQGTVEKGFVTSAGRSANLDLLADVIRRTPDEVPYWGGETYLSLVGAFVPRFLWPDKPTKELGQGFGHRYGYIGANDSMTAINLPILVEFYVNFGMLGVVVGMFVVGIIYRLVERAVNRPGQDDIYSLAGIVLMIPLTNIESDFSLGFGGLILNGLALWLVLRLIRRSKLPSGSSAFTGYATTGLAAQRPRI